MPKQGQEVQVKIIAGEVVEAIKIALKGKKKNRTITLRYAPTHGCIALLEAEFEAVEILIPADGFWDEQIQVNGESLQKMLSVFVPSEIIALKPTETMLFVVRGTLKASLPRIDGAKGKPVKPKPMPNQGHIGPFVARPPMMGGGGMIQVKRDSPLWKALQEQAELAKNK